MHGFCLHVFMYVHHMCTVHGGQKSVPNPQNWSYRGLDGYWELNLCPLQNQPML